MLLLGTAQDLQLPGRGMWVSATALSHFPAFQSWAATRAEDSTPLHSLDSPEGLSKLHQPTPGCLVCCSLALNLYSAAYWEYVLDMPSHPPQHIRYSRAYKRGGDCPQRTVLWFSSAVPESGKSSPDLLRPPYALWVFYWAKGARAGMWI